MNSTLLFVLLVAIPPFLMGCSYLYAFLTQDRRERYIVLLHPGESAQKVAQDHASRFRVGVLHVWGTSIQGYSGVIGARRIQQVRDDPRVHSVERDEMDDEFVVHQNGS